MTTELDSFTVKDLESRYGVARSNIYNRLDGLKRKGYGMDPEKQNGRSIYAALQVAVMDALDAHLKAGHDIGSFPAAEADLSYRPVGQLEKSYRTQDILPKGESSVALALVVEAIASKLQDLKPVDPLENLRLLQEVCDRGWELRTSQLAPLLGLKSLHGSRLQRHGFTFTKVGRIGSESAWRVTKD